MEVIVYGLGLPLLWELVKFCDIDEELLLLLLPLSGVAAGGSFMIKVVSCNWLAIGGVCWEAVEAERGASLTGPDWEDWLVDCPAPITVRS